MAHFKTPTLAYEPRLKGPGPDPSTQMLSDRLLAMADRHRHKLYALLLVIYLLGFNAQWRVEPDSALYLTMGRNVAAGMGYTYNGLPAESGFFRGFRCRLRGFSSSLAHRVWCRR